MQKVAPYFKHLQKAWPFLAIVGVVYTHWLLYALFPLQSRSRLNMVVDAIILIGGVIIVVYTINENLGLFKKQKLPFMALRWLKEFALIGKPRTVEMRDIVSGQGFVGRATLSAKRRWKTPEEHLMELERRIDECRQLVFDKEKEINLRIDRCKQELKNEIHGSNEKIREFEKLLDKTVVGGLKIQLFGVLLLIYGALIPIL